MSVPYPVKLDRRSCLGTGVYSAIDDETTWTLPINDDSFDTIVLSDDHGSAAGTELTSLTIDDQVDPYEVTVSGDYSAGDVVIGISMTARAQLTRPFIRNRNGQAYSDAYVGVKKVTTAHDSGTQDQGKYQIRTSMPNRSDRTKIFNRDRRAEEAGRFPAWMNGNAATMDIYLENNGARPFTITSVEFLCDATRRQGA